MFSELDQVLRLLVSLRTPALLEDAGMDTTLHNGMYVFPHHE